MEREEYQRQLFALIAAMNEALDKQRWRRMSGLHQHLMRLFHEYAVAESSAAELAAVKQRLRAEFGALIERRERHAAELKARMDRHQHLQEGRLAYSIVNLFSETK